MIAQAVRDSSSPRPRGGRRMTAGRQGAESRVGRGARHRAAPSTSTISRASSARVRPRLAGPRPHAHARVLAIDSAPRWPARRAGAAQRGRRPRRERHRPGAPRRAAVSRRGAAFTASPSPGCSPRPRSKRARRRRARRASRTSRCRRSCRSKRRSPPAASSREPERMRRGDPSARWRRRRSASVGRAVHDGQEHFYLETQAALALGRGSRAAVRALVDAAPDRDAGDRRARAGHRQARGDRAVPAHGRRVRRQGDAGQHVGGRRGARRVASSAARCACA